MNGRKAKAARKENGVVKQQKIPTPLEERFHFLLRRGPGRRMSDEHPGTPRSQKKQDRYLKMFTVHSDDASAA